MNLLNRKMSIKFKHPYRSRKWTTGEGVDEVTPKTSRTRSTSSHVGRRKGIILSPTFPCRPEELMTIEQVFCKNFWHTSYSALSFTRQKHKCILPFQAMFLKKKTHTQTNQIIASVNFQYKTSRVNFNYESNLKINVINISIRYHFVIKQSNHKGT